MVEGLGVSWKEVLHSPDWLVRLAGKTKAGHNGERQTTPCLSYLATRTSGLLFKPKSNFSTLKVDLVLEGGLGPFDLLHNVARLNISAFSAFHCHQCV